MKTMPAVGLKLCLGIERILRRKRLSLLSRGRSFEAFGRQSHADILHQLQLLQMQQVQGPPPSTSVPQLPELQVIPALPAVPARLSRTISAKPRRSSLLQCPDTGSSSILSDLGIIPRVRRKSDVAAPGIPAREEPLAGKWQPLPLKDTPLDRVSENSEAKSLGRRSSKVLRAENVGETWLSNPQTKDKAESAWKEEEDAPHHSKTLMPRHCSKESAKRSFFSGIFRTETDLELQGPGCEPLTNDFGYEFELLDCWHRSDKHSAKVTRFHRLVTRSSLSKYLGSSVNDDSEDSEVVFVIKPFSAKKIAWDIVIFGVVLHDGVVLPLQLLGIQIYLSRMLGWLFAIIWTIDAVTSSCISYERLDGTWETRLSRTFRKYLTGFFLPDVVLAILSWVELFVSSQTFQLVRILRLARLWRIEAILQLISNNIRSERAVLCIGISGKILWLMVFLHFMACFWVALGRQDGGWVTVHRPGASDVEQYSVAFHWALAQFHGTMELFPYTLEERIFAFTYLLLAYLLAVVFISFITSAMTRLHLITGVQAAHQRVLRWFLIDNGISRQLTARIYSNLKTTLTVQQHAVPESEVEFLDLVSENLRMELHCEMYGPSIRHHPLFEPINTQLVKQLCHTAITLAIVSYGDLVFIQGEVPVEPRMVFANEGGLMYFRSGRYEPIPVHHGQHAAEPVLWTDWLHHGTLRVASLRARLLLLNASRFQELAVKNTSPDVDLFAYASEYVRQFNELDPLDRHDLWDGMDLSQL
ncbi:unnamed protein product [Durusdinium trenchii]|uniref:Uncharacterized protein n=1 Tax=Durusdinium trenchii TaxID=1381693 RepID=A0ABP0JV84_9DINO